MQDIEKADRVVIVVAHPDDEVIGAGGILSALRNVWVIHTTDGSPRDTGDALRHGFASGKEYAAARREELRCALGLAGVPWEHAIPLGFTDQETMYRLPAVCRRLKQELSRLQPDIVVTQPYEGGHPDHDSTAFAVQRCLADHERLYEMTSYYACDGGIQTGRFLPGGDAGTARAMTAEEQALKKRMIGCFKSQAAVLRQFPVLPEERFRVAPQYDFTQPPHAGQLHYERMPWGIQGEAWRKLAAQCA